MAVSFIMTKIMYHLKWYENDKTIPFFDDLFAIRASLHCRRFPRSTRGERNCKRMRKIRSRKRRSWSADPGCLTTNLTVTRAACTHAWLRASSTRACSSWCRWTLICLDLIDRWWVPELLEHFFQYFYWHKSRPRVKFYWAGSWRVVNGYKLPG